MRMCTHLYIPGLTNTIQFCASFINIYVFMVKKIHCLNSWSFIIWNQICEFKKLKLTWKFARFWDIIIDFFFTIINHCLSFFAFLCYYFCIIFWIFVFLKHTSIKRKGTQWLTWMKVIFVHLALKVFQQWDFCITNNQEKCVCVCVCVFWGCDYMQNVATPVPHYTTSPKKLETNIVLVRKEERFLFLCRFSLVFMWRARAEERLMKNRGGMQEGEKKNRS